MYPHPIVLEKLPPRKDQTNVVNSDPLKILTILSLKTEPKKKLGHLTGEINHVMLMSFSKLQRPTGTQDVKPQ